MAGLLGAGMPDTGLLSPATVNPLMARQFAIQRQNMTQPTSVMDERYPAWKKAQDQADLLLMGADIAGSVAPLLGPTVRGAAMAGKALAPKAADMAEGYMARTGLLQPATVWHGSPHRFDAFDASKIGTGEGAQAYGHGLYFAENPKVAAEYSKMNPSTIVPPNRIFQGRELVPGTPEYHAGTLLERSTLPAARKEVAGWISEGSPDPKVLEGWKKTLETLNSAKSKADFKVGSNANLYKVDLPDEHIAKMLDWDKPLSQQPAEVQGVLKRRITSVEPTDKFDMGGNALLRDNRQGQYDKSRPYPWILEAKSSNGTSAFGLSQKDVERMFGSKDVKDLTGEQIMSRLTEQNGGSAAASSYLNKLGIPGIRYLDGGSRGAGQGTSNFVVFPGNEGLLKILERQ